MRQMLDIIIPHWNEPFSTGKTLFDMLAMQKGADFEQIRVLLIHDGSDPFPDETFSGYPYQVEQHCIPHSGVSAARNRGLELAKAKWVTFCDFDDYYSDLYAMKIIQSVLDDEEHDLLWNPIWMEDMRYGKLAVFPLTKFNMIFVHNKYMRLDFIRANGLKFNEDLQYSEDSSFLAVMNVMLEQERIGKIASPMPLYTWSYRPGSCTADREKQKRNIEHLFDANRFISMEFERLNCQDASLMKYRAVCDAYFCLTGADTDQDTELEQRVLAFWKANREEIGKCAKGDLVRVFESSERNHRRRGENLSKRPTLAEWLKGLER